MESVGQSVPSFNKRACATNNSLFKDLTQALLNSWKIMLYDDIMAFFSCFIPEHINDVFILIGQVYYGFSNIL